MQPSTAPSEKIGLCQPSPVLAELGLPAALAFTPSAWRLERALAWSRDGNPRYSCGAGARRRSKCEHQLDRHLAMLRATYVPGATVRVSRYTVVHAWELLHAPLTGPAPAVVAYRARLAVLIEWCRANHPREGWARRQSPARARRLAHATEYNLPARSRRAFYTWRRAVRAIARLLLVLHAWWERLCPARRFSPSTTESETARTADRRGTTGLERGGGHSGPRSVGELLGQARPGQAM